MKLTSMVLAALLLPAAALANDNPNPTPSTGSGSDQTQSQPYNQPSTQDQSQGMNAPQQQKGSSDVQVDTFEWSTGQGRLGLMVMGLTSDLRSYFGAPPGGGLLVAQVASNSPAEKAGIKVGDVITKVDNKLVKSAGDVISSLSSTDTNRKIPIELVRDHKTIDVQAALGSRSQQQL